MELPGFQGQVLAPNDEGYEQARAIWNGAIDRRPALIARCTGTADVCTAVRWGRAERVAVSVRAGGHGVAGTALVDGGLVIDLSAMKGVGVDPRRGRVWVQAGVLLGELDRETQLFGLAVPAGVISHTGVAGLTLGGGIGYLMRKHGLTCDNLLGAEVVTADGEVVHASAEENEDLLWGLRGGGGNFGVVTSFEFQAHPFGPTVLAGSLIYAAEDAREVLEAYGSFIREAPDEIGTVMNLRWAPPAPWIPPELHGREVIFVSCVYAGDVADGETAVKPLRHLARPLADLVKPRPFTEHQRMYDGAVPHGLGYYWKSPYLRDMDEHTITTLAGSAWEASSHRSYTIIFQMGGAVGRLPAEASAFEDRTAAFAPNINAVWEQPRERHRDIEWVRRLYNQLEPSSTGKRYVNFQSEIETVDAYGDQKYARLAKLKKRWDPDNFFNSTQNIAPSLA